MGYRTYIGIIKKDKRNNLSEWENNSAIDLSTKNDVITNAGIYEFSVFELVRLYKTIDYEKYELVFYTVNQTPASLLHLDASKWLWGGTWKDKKQWQIN